MLEFIVINVFIFRITLHYNKLSPPFTIHFMSQLKKLAGQTAVYGLSSIIGRFLNYLLVPLYTYNFMPQEYGVVTEMYAYVSFLIVFLTYGMETGYFRFSMEENEEHPVYSTILVSLIASSAIFLTLAVLFSNKLGNILAMQQGGSGGLSSADYSRYVIWFTLIVSLDAVTTIPFAQLRAAGKAKKFAVIKLLNLGMNIGFNLFFILLCPYIIRSGNPALVSIIGKVYNPVVGVGYIFIANLIASIFTLLLLLPDMLGVKFRFDPQLWKKIVGYSLPLLILGIAGVINENIDRIMLKWLLVLPFNEKMAQIGIYGACYKLSIVMTISIQAFRYAADPFFFSHAKNKDAPQLYADVMKFFVIGCSFIFLLTMMYIDVVKYFVGKNFHSGLNIVPILLLANLCLGVYFNLSIWFKLTDKTRFGAYISIGGALITIILNYWWIPIMGFTGAAWATLVCYASMMVASYIFGQRHYPVNYDNKRILGYLGLALSLYFISTIIHTGEYLHLFINTILLLVYVMIVFITERGKN